MLVKPKAAEQRVVSGINVDDRLALIESVRSGAANVDSHATPRFFAMECARCMQT
jgi:hypothetical protein